MLWIETLSPAVNRAWLGYPIMPPRATLNVLIVSFGRLACLGIPMDSKADFIAHNVLVVYRTAWRGAAVRLYGVEV